MKQIEVDEREEKYGYARIARKGRMMWKRRKITIREGGMVMEGKKMMKDGRK